MMFTDEQIKEIDDFAESLAKDFTTKKNKSFVHKISDLIFGVLKRHRLWK